MTALSEYMRQYICNYCANAKGGCLANVPYYAVTMQCRHFAEEPLPRVVKPTSVSQIKRKVIRSLVETF